MDFSYNNSPLQLQRLYYQPKLPNILSQLRQVGETTQESQEQSIDPAIKKLFPQTCNQKPILFTLQSTLSTSHTPKRVGVVLSGGQAPGGHNVIIGLFDALQSLHHESRLFGFLNGPSGILKNEYIEITRDIVQRYRNQGGFDMIGSGRTKIETPEQFQAAAVTADALQLDAFVIIGGDDSNTNAAILAEYLKAKGLQVDVIGVPKTIDGDLKNEHIEISFGFDTAAKTYSDIIGNIARDALSAKKYYHFVKLMGRSASHIALECALQTHANLTLIGEEVFVRGMTLRSITQEITDLICHRAEHGKNYGLILIPEGIIEFIPEFRILISELNTLLAPEKTHAAVLENLEETGRKTYLEKQLSQEAFACFTSLPSLIQDQLLMDRDPHGNVQVSKIETERLFISTVAHELSKRKKEGTYNGKFNPQPHFLGYEGRSCFPSNFDAKYCYALGHVAALLINSNATGYMCSIKNLAGPVEEWQCGGVPLVSMLVLEERHGKSKPVIRKALVNLKGEPFRAFDDARSVWALEDCYAFPGPIQFSGLPAVSESITVTLSLET